MNSLEFIEKEIEDRKENIKHWEKQLECYPNSDVFTRCVNMCNEQLQILEQIKTELEAWEELKKYIVLMEEQYPLYDTTYEYIELENGCIDESNTDEEGKSIMIIKRALEINYESEE